MSSLFLDLLVTMPERVGSPTNARRFASIVFIGAE